MKLLRFVFDFYINSSIHVALAVVAFTYLTAIEFYLPITPFFYGFVFFGSITAYNFVKYAAVAALHHRSLIFSLKVIQLFSFLCFLLFIFFLTQIALKTLLLFFSLGLITFFYAVPLLPIISDKKTKNSSHRISLRTLPSIKIAVVGVVWTGTTVIAPVLEYDTVFSLSIMLTALQRFLLVVVLILPFDIRDISYDLEVLKTLPQLLGVQKTKVIGLFFLVVVIVLELFKGKETSLHLYELLFACTIMGVMLWITKKKQSKYFASFGIESIPIVLVLSTYLFRHFLS